MAIRRVMTRPVLAEILMLVAGASIGCRGGERSAPLGVIGDRPPSTTPALREVVRASSLGTSPLSADASIKSGATGDIIQFTQGGMIGQTKVEWDSQTSSRGEAE
jgi:hypothetical protein